MTVQNSVILSIVLSGITGCAGLNNDNGQQQLDSMMSTCRAQGYSDGTEPFKKCMFSLADAIYGSSRGTTTPPSCYNCFGVPSYGPAPAPSYQQGTHTYLINGRTVTCTTTGSYTNCF